jgi:hypothetical protein
MRVVAPGPGSWKAAMSSPQWRTTSSTSWVVRGSGPWVIEPRQACNRVPTSAAAAIVASTYGSDGPAGKK